MKRSNRLILLIGVFLAIVAFVLVFVVLQGSQTTNNNGTTAAPTTGPVVVAKTDIPLSTRIQPDQVEVKTLNLTAINAGAFQDPSQVVGQIARQPVAAGAQITQTTLNGGLSGTVIDVQTPAGQRAIAVRVDQISGVGTVIKTGDYVDAIFALTEEQFASITQDPANPRQVVVTNPGPKGTTIKLILQGMQVLGTLLPPVAAPPTNAPANAQASAAPAEPGTVLNEQQEIVILSVSPQQAEVLRYAQVQANPLITLSLVLRSPDDFIDPKTGQPVPPVVTQTTGITLKELIDKYGVLPPVVEPPVLPTIRP